MRSPVFPDSTPMNKRGGVLIGRTFDRAVERAGEDYAVSDSLFCATPGSNLRDIMFTVRENKEPSHWRSRVKRTLVLLFEKDRCSKPSA